MSRDPLLSDIAMAVIAAILILALTPGVAVAGMIALLVLLACAVNLILDSRRRSPGPSRSVPSPQSRSDGRRANLDRW